MNIRSKIGLSMAMLAFAVAIFIGAFSIMISRDTLKDRSKEFLVSILNRTSYEINLQINATEKVTNFIYNDFLLTYNFNRGESDKGYREKYLEKFEGMIRLAAELNPSKSAYLILVNNGVKEIIWYRDYNNDGIPERNFDESSYNRFEFEKLDATKLSWVGMQNSSKEISCIKVIERDNETVAIVGTDLNYYLIKSKLDTSKYLDSGVLYVTESDGRIIYHPIKIVGIFDELILFDNMDVETIELKNEFKVPIVLAKSILNNGWMLAISAETSDIYLGLSRLNYIIMIILVFAGLITVIYSIMVSKRIAEPYLYLTNKIEEIGNGNYDVEFDEEYIKRKDEVGVFTNAIRTTVKRQKDSFEEINNYNLNLESLISKRTEELINTNEALEESVINTEEKQEILEDTNKKLEESINEIKRTRKKLIKSEKIASSRYVAIGIAHNLNTPIGSAKSIASFIESRTSKIIDKLTEDELTKTNLTEFLIETRNGSQKILESIDDSILLIDKMKALSLIRTTENKGLINVEEVIRIQVENSKKEHIELECEFTILVDENLNFRCDSYNLQKLFYELIENSYTHAFNNIAKPHITIKSYRNDIEINGIVVEYYDNGVGVDEELRSELFTPLYTTKLSSRHGLGLTMVYNLVNESFNGDISIESSRNKGLTFFINLYEDEKKPEEVSYEE